MKSRSCLMWGLSVSITSISPGATTAEVIQTTSESYIHLLWKNIPSGTEMKASFKISSNILGNTRLFPSSTAYYNQKKRYTGVCNTAFIAFRQETIPIESKVRVINAIEILWRPSSNAGVVGYRIYKRTSISDYNPVNSFYTTGLRYTDTDVQNSVAYYYRVAAVDQSGNEIDVSPETAEMLLNTTIKTYSAPPVRSSVAIGDIDGNGIPDIAVSTPSPTNRKGVVLPGRVDIYLNNKDVSSVPDITLYGEQNNDQFGTALALVDMNNDGYDDLIVGAPNFDYYPDPTITRSVGKVYVYAGGGSISQSPVKTFNGRNEVCNCDCSGIYVYGEQLGRYITVVGDVNGDGFKDVAIGTELGGLGRSGKIVFLFGGSGIVSSTYELRGLHCDDYIGFSVSSAGDVNGDGYDDVITGNYHSNSVPGKLYMIYGGATRTFQD